MSKYDQANPPYPRCGFQNQSRPGSLRGLKTLPQLASEFGIHPQQITDWKKQALDKFPSLFEIGPLKPALSEQQREEIEAPLFQ